MSRNNRAIALALLLAVGGSAKCAMALTLAEMSAKQAESLAAELDSKKRGPGALGVIQAAPGSIEAEEFRQFQLLSIAGVEDDLRVRIRYQGVTYTLTKDDKVKLSGWGVAEILSNKVVFRKEFTTGKGKRAKTTVKTGEVALAAPAARAPMAAGPSFPGLPQLPGTMGPGASWQPIGVVQGAAPQMATGQPVGATPVPTPTSIQPPQAAMPTMTYPTPMPGAYAQQPQPTK